LDLQNKLQCKYTGGTVLHMYMNEKLDSADSCRRFVKSVLTNYQLPYITVTPVFSVCDTHGYLKGEMPTCPDCGGSGTINLGRGPLRFSQTCSRCHGAGTIVSNPCAACLGQGVVLRTERIQVRIPAGVNNGSRIRLSGKGGAGLHGGPPGDLFVVIQVAPHPYFRREGDDIFLEVPISVAESVLGAQVVIPTIDGQSSLKIPPGIRSGQKLRLTGKGAHHLKGGGRGDHYAVIAIVPPKKLSEKAKALIKEFATQAREDPRAEVGW